MPATLSAKLEEFQALLRSIDFDGDVRTDLLTARVRNCRLIVTCQPDADWMTRCFQAFHAQNC